MLQAIIKASAKIFITILVGLLILSFALWGVGDIFTGQVNDTVATVNGEDISSVEIDRKVEKELSQMRNYFGQDLLPEMIEKLGLDKKALRDTINERLISAHANDLGIIVGDKPVAMEIAINPAFRDEQGNFQAGVFDEYLRSQRETEASFAGKLKLALARQVIIDTLTSRPAITSDVVDQMYKYENQQRKLDILKIPSDLISEVSAPDENDLATYFEKNKENFAAPEYRQISYILLDRSTVNAEEQITEEDLREEYEHRLSIYGTPEKREILHVIFGEKEEADEAAKLISEGADFYDVAKEKAGQERTETDFGEITPNDLPKEISDPAFAMKEGEVSEVVESDLGFHIVKIKKITPATQKTFEEVKDKVWAAVIDDKSADIIYSLSTKLEDSLAGGSTFDEAAKEIGVSVLITPEVARDGRQQDGEVLSSIPEGTTFLTRSFDLRQGEVSELIPGDDGESYYILRVDKINDSRIKAIDEVKGLAIEAWKEDKKKELLHSIAKDAEQMMRTGKTFAEIKTALANGNDETRKYGAEISKGIKTDISETVSRISKSNPNVPQNMIKETFMISTGESTVYYQAEDGSFVIGKLVKDFPAEKDEQRLEETKRALAYDYADDIWEQYLNHLRQSYSIKIYEDNPEN